jgi:hypothetical protein
LAAAGLSTLLVLLAVCCCVQQWCVDFLPGGQWCIAVAVRLSLSLSPLLGRLIECCDGRAEWVHRINAFVLSIAFGGLMLGCDGWVFQSLALALEWLLSR